MPSAVDGIEHLPDAKSISTIESAKSPAPVRPAKSRCGRVG
jgi:hypothetical protein